MELPFEDYWKVVRPRRAKTVGGPSIPLCLLEPLVSWLRDLSFDSKSYQVLPGESRESNLKYLQSRYPFRAILRAPVDGASDLVDPLVQLLRDTKINSSVRTLLNFEPPTPLEWDLIWCLIAIPHTSISSELLRIASQDPRLIDLYKAIEELRYNNYFEKRPLISIEEGIQELTNSISSKRRDILNSLMFLVTLAGENGLLDPFTIYLDTKGTTNGLLGIMQTCKTWEPYGSPMKLLIGCEDHAKFIPMIHKNLTDGLAWMSSG